MWTYWAAVGFGRARVRAARGARASPARSWCSATATPSKSRILHLQPTVQTKFINFIQIKIFRNIIIVITVTEESRPLLDKVLPQRLSDHFIRISRSKSYITFTFSKKKKTILQQLSIYIFFFIQECDLVPCRLLTIHTYQVNQKFTQIAVYTESFDLIAF